MSSGLSTCCFCGVGYYCSNICLNIKLVLDLIRSRKGAVIETKGLFSDGEWVKIKGDLQLSDRQAEILHLLLGGHSDKQIATKLGIAMPTVRTYLGRLFLRYDVSDRVELVLHIFCKYREQCFKYDCPIASEESIE